MLNLFFIVFFLRRLLFTDFVGLMKIGGFWIRFTGNNSVMNSGGEPVVVSTVVVGLEVVDVALKSLMISFKVLGFSEMYKDHQELKYQKMPKTR